MAVSASAPQAPASASPASSAGPAHAGDAPAAWLGVASLAVASFVMVSTEFLPVGLLPEIAAGLGVTEGVAGRMVTMPGIAAALAAPLLIVGAGRLDRRLVLLTLTALLMVANLIGALAPNFSVMLAGRLLLGICVGGFWAFAPGAGAQLVPAASQARALSIILAGISVGTVAGVPAASLIGSHLGWRSAFGISAGLAGVLLVAQWRLLPSVPAGQALRARDLLEPLKLRLGVVGLLSVVLLFVGHFGAYTYLKPLLQQVFGLGPQWVAALLGVYGVVGLVGNFVGGWVLARSPRVLLAGAAALLSAALLLVPLLGHQAAVAVLLVVVWGLAFGAVPVAVTGWMMHAVPNAPEAGQALLVAVIQVAIACGALGGGLLVDGYGVYSAVVAGGIFAAVGAVVVGLWGRASRTAAQPSARVSPAG